MSYIQEVQEIIEDEIQDKLMEEIFDLVMWNLSFGISIKETLDSVNRPDLLECFENDI